MEPLQQGPQLLPGPNGGRIPGVLGSISAGRNLLGLHQSLNTLLGKGGAMNLDKGGSRSQESTTFKREEPETADRSQTIPADALTWV